MSLLKIRSEEQLPTIYLGENDDIVKGKLNEHEKYAEPRFRPNGHRLCHHQLSRSMPEQMIMDVNAEHDNMVSLRSSMIRQYKYPEAQSLPPPGKFSKSRSRLARFERIRSVDSINFLSVDLAEAVSHDPFEFHEPKNERINSNNPLRTAKMSTQLASTWEAIMGHITQPAATASACITPQNEIA